MNERAKAALAAVRSRRSHRKYKPDPVSREDLSVLVDAGRLAATARNVQPWHFVVVTDAAKRQRLAEITEHGKFIAQAPACIVVACEDTKYYLEDGCAAAQNILVAAEALGLGTCWVAGDKKPYARQILDVVGAPMGVKLICLIAVGCSAADTPRAEKKPLGEVLHWENWTGSP